MRFVVVERIVSYEVQIVESCIVIITGSVVLDVRSIGVLGIPVTMAIECDTHLARTMKIFDRDGLIVV